ncbi:MAG TPA: M3 family metallopeptidase [Oscillatoriaceae cyanobacterium]
MTLSLDQESRWDLSRLYESPEDPRIDEDLRQARETAESLRAAHLGRVAEMAPLDVRVLLDRLDEQAGVLNRLFSYAYLCFSSDTQDDANKTLYARIQREVPEIQNETVFFQLELQKMPEGRYRRLYEAPELAIYQDHLGRIRRVSAYALDELAERIVALKDSTGLQGWIQFYFETTADFKLRLGLPNVAEELNLSQTYALRESNDRAERKAALEASLRVHAENSRGLTFVFNALFANYRHMMELRGYSHPFQPLLVEESLDPKVIEGLMQAVESSYGLVHRYFRAKARAMGLSDFAMHDVRAKYPQGASFVAFEDGRDIVLDSYSSFSPRLGEIARGFFEEGYIDALSRPGKRAGAYCLSSGPVFHPFIFLNYNYSLKDVIVMAHEMGHGVHNVLGGERHNLTNTDRVTMFMETPSTFGETLTFNRLLTQEVNPVNRQALLGTQIEAAILKIFKSIALTRFQLNAYELRQNSNLGASEYCVLWREQIEAMYGEAVAFSEWDEWEWLSFEHTLNLPFYDYAYSFGQLLVYGLMRRYEEEGAAFEPKYLELLSSGTSITIGPLLEKVGVDLNEPSFWYQGLSYLEQMLEEFEASLEMQAIGDAA